MKNQTTDEKLEIIALLIAAKSSNKPVLIKRTSKGGIRPEWAFAKVTQINLEAGEICVSKCKRLQIGKICGVSRLGGMGRNKS